MTVSPVAYAWTDLLRGTNHPPVRRCNSSRITGGIWLLVLPLARPLRPPLLKNPLQKLLAGFEGAAFAAGEFGFGGDEAAFYGVFEDGGFVAFEVGLDALEVGDGFVEAGELLFDFGDDFVLARSSGGKRNLQLRQHLD